MARETLAALRAERDALRAERDRLAQSMPKGGKAQSRVRKVDAAPFLCAQAGCGKAFWGMGKAKRGGLKYHQRWTGHEGVIER